MRNVAARDTLEAMESLPLRHVRAVRPVEFPPSDVEWDMPESLRHKRLCELMYQLLREAVDRRSSVGADQFVFFDPQDPSRKCAPDAFLKLDVAQTMFDSWKTWEHGAPDLCIEILSPKEAQEKLPMDQKLERCRAMGVREIVAYNVDAEPGQRLRAWDLLHGDLVERIIDADATPCRTLGLWFVLAPGLDDDQTLALRLATDAQGLALVPTPTERERAAKERERAAKERERAAKERERAAKEEALAKVAELEAKLRG